MIITFILGVLAGWFAKLVEPRVKTVAERATSGTGPLEPVELRLFALTAALVLAAILASLLTHHASPIMLTLGACLGVLGPRLRKRWDARKTPDYDS